LAVFVTIWADTYNNFGSIYAIHYTVMEKDFKQSIKIK
jgi:hypothetical protein